jgi:hypothetical protein
MYIIGAHLRPESHGKDKTRPNNVSLGLPTIPTSYSPRVSIYGQIGPTAEPLQLLALIAGCVDGPQVQGGEFS